MVRTAASIALAVFGAFSAWVVWEVGYLAIWQSLLTGPAAWQVGFDIVLFGLLSMLWMAHDAKRTGRTVWPYLPLTLLAGSVGPLLYLALAPKEQAPYAAPRAA
jgi:hypothetical protein